MKIHRSNRTEKLADALAELLSEEPLDPMMPEIIAVQGRGMERWLSLQLAQKLGIAANIRFPFPRAAVEEVLASVLGEQDGQAAARYRPESLVFDLLELLPELLSNPRFDEVSRYLAEAPLERGKPIGTRGFALCERIARVFDGYFTYRPDMVLRWLGKEERGEELGWQPELLRVLRERIGGPSFPELVQTATAKLERGPLPLQGLSARISFFGLSTLPPLYLRLLGALPESLPVHLFLLCPSDQYWADVMTQREAARALSRAGWQKSPEDLAITVAHPLLDAFGKVGREFQLVLETELDSYEDDERFEPPVRKNLLTALQADLLEQPSPPTSPAPTPTPSASPTASPSIQIHACHGTTRQVEVLRDALVRLFDELPDLQPRDVVVMAPDIDELAPIIEAVFSDGDEDDQNRAGFPRLPYRIADRPASTENPVAEALLALLDLARSRMRAPEVLAFLGSGPVSHKFGFDVQELSTLRRWLDETSVRWGEDSLHRAAQGVSIGDEQSFRDGLDRMLLGHAMRGGGTRLFEGKLGYEDASDSKLLGSFVDAISRLFDVVKAFRQAGTLEQFRDRVELAMEQLFETPAGDRWQAQAVRKALSDLVEAQDQLSAKLVFEPEALARLVEVPLRSASSDSFASGAITFCAMVPMRSVPFRVVCLLGMDDGAFPRRTTKEGFDLTAHAHRPGDRRLEDDDRYLVLEALLSARDRFLVFYSGRDIANNERLPPIAPITELLEAVATTMRIEDNVSERERRKRAEEKYLVEHPLQPFGPASFLGNEGRISTRSYDLRRLEAARALVSEPVPQPRFFTGLSPKQIESFQVEQISVDDLARFFADPVRGFFNQRLGIRFRDEEGEIDDRERLELNHLESFKVHDAALELLRQGHEPPQIENILRARSILPFGVAGPVKAREAIRAVSAWQGTLDTLEEGGRREPIGILLDLAPLRVTGRLRDVYAKGRLRVTWSKEKAHRRVEEWVRHIVYCASEGNRAGLSVLVEKGKDDEPEITTWEPLPNARELLDNLVLLFFEGMKAPLLFFPEPAKAYSRELTNPKVAEQDREAKAVEKAWDLWAKGDFSGRQALCEEPHHKRLFANIGRELFRRDFEWPGDYWFPDLVEALWEASEGAK